MGGPLKKHFYDEDAAREHLEELLWKNGPVCPHCGVIENIYKLESKPDSKHKLRKGVYKGGGCRKQFTVTVNTIFEGSHIPLHKWLMAFHLMCSSKKGISALQLQRELSGEDEETKKPKGSYRTAWFMCHRIRWVMTPSPMLRSCPALSNRRKPILAAVRKTSAVADRTRSAVADTGSSDLDSTRL